MVSRRNFRIAIFLCTEDVNTKGNSVQILTNWLSLRWKQVYGSWDGWSTIMDWQCHTWRDSNFSGRVQLWLILKIGGTLSTCMNWRIQQNRKNKSCRKYHDSNVLLAESERLKYLDSGDDSAFRTEIQHVTVFEYYSHECSFRYLETVLEVEEGKILEVHCRDGLTEVVAGGWDESQWEKTAVLTMRG